MTYLNITTETSAYFVEFLAATIDAATFTRDSSLRTAFHMFDTDVTWVRVEDPYIRAHHQILNLVRLCELMVKNCRPSFKSLTVNTSVDPHTEQVRAGFIFGHDWLGT